MIESFDQMNLFPRAEKELGMEREQEFLKKALPVMHNATISKNANPQDITYEILENYSSTKFRSSVIFRIKMRGKKWYVSIPDRLKDAIAQDTKTTKTASEKKYLRIDLPLSVNTDLLMPFIEKCTILAIELVPKEFDCCSRFNECSDAKVCVHPDPSVSMLCGYRKILKSGRIFYGTNRNID